MRRLTRLSLTPRQYRQVAELARIFVTQQPFGPRTNALVPAREITRLATAHPNCGADRTFSVTSPPTEHNPFLCAEPGGIVVFHDAAGRRLGTAGPDTFARSSTRGTLVDRVRASAGTVEIVSAGGHLYVANFRAAGALSYSLAFPYSPPA